MYPVLKMTTLTAVLALTAACAPTQTQHPYGRTAAGAGIGAVTGAILGHQIDRGAGTAVGAVVGGLTGAAVGNYMDRQQHAFEQALAEERRLHNLEIQRLQDGSLKLNIPSEVSFDFDSAAIKPGFRSTLEQIAEIMQQYDQTVIHIIGHTDSTGPAEYNMQLSQRRADSAAQFLAARGVSGQRLRTEGRGENEPRASNATPDGRQLNRRVEMFIRPIVEGQEQRAYEPPRAAY